VRRPPRELAGFARVALDAGATERVTIGLDDRAFAFVHPRSGAWTAPTGAFEVSVGASSRDLRARVVVER
jgi:beta-glucosidase